jgi:hypothetical protein
MKEKNIRTVGEPSAEAMSREAALDGLYYPLQELAANLLRTVRGAGKPHELGGNLMACIHAFEAYKEANGYWPSAELLASILKFDSGIEELQGRSSKEDFDRWEQVGLLDRMQAEYEVCRGALQIVASRILGQRTQESAGSSELSEGIRSLESARNRRRGTDRP